MKRYVDPYKDRENKCEPEALKYAANRTRRRNTNASLYFSLVSFLIVGLNALFIVLLYYGETAEATRQFWFLIPMFVAVVLNFIIKRNQWWDKSVLYYVAQVIAIQAFLLFSLMISTYSILNNTGLHSLFIVAIMVLTFIYSFNYPMLISNFAPDVLVFIYLRYKFHITVDPLLDMLFTILFVSIAIVGGVYSYRALTRNYCYAYTSKVEHKQLEYLSNIDALTGLYNRRKFEEEYKKIFENATKNGDKVGVFIFDIDDFKFYNDVFGHQRGDEILKEVALAAKSLRTEQGKDLIISRWGGEEFMIVAPENSKQNSDEIIQLMYAAIKKLNIKAPDIITRSKILTVSMGVYIAEPGDFTDWEDAYRKADNALYYCKNNGKQSCTIFHNPQKEQQ